MTETERVQNQTVEEWLAEWEAALPKLDTYYPTQTKENTNGSG